MVNSFRKISDLYGGFTAVMADELYFGSSVGFLGDLNSDAIPEYVFGARGYNDGVDTVGSVFVTFANGMSSHNTS